jgi:hypothetical protein
VEHPVDFQVVVGVGIILLSLLHERCERSLRTGCSGKILVRDGRVGVIPRECWCEPSRVYWMGGGGCIGGVQEGRLGAQK